MTTEPGAGPGEFLLTRFIITCCVADATIAQVKVVDAPPGALQDNQWVQRHGEALSARQRHPRGRERRDADPAAGAPLPHAVAQSPARHRPIRSSRWPTSANPARAATRSSVRSSVRSTSAGNGQVLHAPARSADQVVMVPGQILGELVPSVLVVGHHPAHHARLLEVAQVPVDGALREVPAAPQDLRDGDRAARRARGCPRAAGADPCIAARSRAGATRRCRAGRVATSVTPPPPRVTLRRATPRVTSATTAKIAAVISTMVPPGRQIPDPRERETPRPPRPRRSRSTSGACRRTIAPSSWPLATGSTIIAAIRRMPTIFMAATTAHAVSTASRLLRAPTGSPDTRDQSSSVTTANRTRRRATTTTVITPRAPRSSRTSPSLAASGCPNRYVRMFAFESVRAAHQHHAQRDPRVEEERQRQVARGLPAGAQPLDAQRAHDREQRAPSRPATRSPGRQPSPRPRRRTRCARCRRRSATSASARGTSRSSARRPRRRPRPRARAA